MPAVDDTGMSEEEILAVASKARDYIQEKTGHAIDPNCPVVYERSTILAKIRGEWWVMMLGDEERLDQQSVLLLPFALYFSHADSMLGFIAKHDGAQALMDTLGVEVSFVSDDDTPGEDSPTLN